MNLKEKFSLKLNIHKLFANRRGRGLNLKEGFIDDAKLAAIHVRYALATLTSEQQSLGFSCDAGHKKGINGHGQLLVHLSL